MWWHHDDAANDAAGNDADDDAVDIIKYYLKLTWINFYLYSIKRINTILY